MKRLFVFILVLTATFTAIAQIPYFAGTVGDGKMYGYSSVKARPGINQQETYTTFQYGLDNQWAAGIDLYTGLNTAYWGSLLRWGTSLSKWFNVGAECTSSFNLNDNFKFAYLTSALYLNGAITADSRLFWCTNTWWVVNNGASSTYSNYEYLGYTLPLGKGQSITPMAGVIHSWKFDQDASLAAGFYYTLRNWNFYIWGNDFLQAHPRFVIGIDFVL